jgi:hypothetical protein
MGPNVPEEHRDRVVTTICERHDRKLAAVRRYRVLAPCLGMTQTDMDECLLLELAEIDMGLR